MNKIISQLALIGAGAARFEGLDGDSVEMYFGLGCFWHMQHYFVEGERNVLGRNDSELTSIVGYAGGSQVGPQGQVCYHGEYDYGKFGHAEVV